MKVLKIVALNTVVWFMGVVLFFYWIQWDLKRNPIPAEADGSIPDSFIIWVFNFAIAFLLFLILVNLAYAVARFLWQKSKRRPVN